MAKPTLKSEAWTLFDRLIERATREGYSNPWRLDSSEGLVFEPDYDLLCKLLAVPILLKAGSNTGIKALALDVWTAHELRRAGFDRDRVWPRNEAPRILPSTLVAMGRLANKTDQKVLDRMVKSGKTFSGEIGANANILGKNYVKQVDVVISAWNTGPELMISTKRMDSSFGNNAANRVEESYGDAKNLRSRHPQAALGFIYSLRSTAFESKTKAVADWIVDLLGKLGREEDAYDAVALVVPQWHGSDPEVEEADSIDLDDDQLPLVAAGIEAESDDEGTLPLDLPTTEIDRRLDDLPIVELLHTRVPPELRPETFFKTMIARVLSNCPINFHETARELRDKAANP